jgi:hypothetical protein
LTCEVRIPVSRLNFSVSNVFASRIFMMEF